MYETIEEIRQLVTSTLISCKLGDLAPKMKIQFNDRFSQCLGEANFNTLTINFSSRLWKRAGDADRYEVIIHETCHIIADHFFGVDKKAHAEGWRYLMSRFNLEPKACHRVMPMNQHRVVCGCGTSSRNNRHLVKLSKGESVACRDCNQCIKLVANPPIRRVA